MMRGLAADAKERQALAGTRPNRTPDLPARMPEGEEDQDLPVDPEPVPEKIPGPVSSAGESREKAAAAGEGG